MGEKAGQLQQDGIVRIDSSTRMYGVYGDPIKHSRSPLMLNRAFQEAGLNAVYAAFHIKPGKLEQAVAGIRGMDFGGVNVTIPHKVELMSYLDEIDETARFAGAANTVVNRDGTLVGYNTDGIGYVRSLKEETGVDLRGKRILLLGAGGAARGVGYGLAKEGAGLLAVANRTVSKANELAELLSPLCDVRGYSMDELAAVGRMKQFDIVINTTSVGMSPGVDELPIDPELLHSELLVSDLIYNPLETRLLREAKLRGARTHGGLGMFIYQGAYAFEYWTGLPAPVSAMREVVVRSLQAAGK